MRFKHVAALVAGRAVHRILCGRPFWQDLDISDPLAVLASAHREWTATTACYAVEPKIFEYDVRSLLIGLEAYQLSKPNRWWREALFLYAPLPEWITPSGRTWVNQHGVRC
jgi:hypothetical protein